MESGRETKDVGRRCYLKGKPSEACLASDQIMTTRLRTKCKITNRQFLITLAGTTLRRFSKTAS